MLNKIKDFFASQSAKSDLEQYILSKNPTSCQDVEYWIRQYDQRPNTMITHMFALGGVYR